MYNIYVTLLDAFQYYLESESETAKQELIDKINRVPFESEAADKGSAFHELIEKLVHNQDYKGRYMAHPDPDEFPYKYANPMGTIYEFQFNRRVIDELSEYFSGCVSEYRLGCTIQTGMGEVYLYGVIDHQNGYKTFDLKTTSNYTFPKYLMHWQHKAYPYIMRANGHHVDEFEYVITDFRNVYRESYIYQDYYAELIKIQLEIMIEFIEENRSLITDKKIFDNE
jgi:hypothetical protein